MRHSKQTGTDEGFLRLTLSLLYSSLYLFQETEGYTSARKVQKCHKSLHLLPRYQSRPAPTLPPRSAPPGQRSQPVPRQKPASQQKRGRWSTLSERRDMSGPTTTKRASGSCWASSRPLRGRTSKKPGTCVSFCRGRTMARDPQRTSKSTLKSRKPGACSSGASWPPSSKSSARASSRKTAAVAEAVLQYGEGSHVLPRRCRRARACFVRR